MMSSFEENLREMTCRFVLPMGQLYPPPRDGEVENTVSRSPPYGYR